VERKVGLKWGGKVKGRRKEEARSGIQGKNVYMPTNQNFYKGAEIEKPRNRKI